MSHKRLLQTVKGNPAHEVVDMMDPDAPREPTHWGWKIQVRASMKGRFLEGPLITGVPMCAFELVLNVEQPDPYRRRTNECW